MKPHISATQLDMACRCPAQYERRYIDGDVLPPGIAILSGKGFHKGAETNMRQKIASRVDLPASEIVDAAVAAFETEAAGGYVLSEDEDSRGAGVVVGEAKDRLANMARVHAEQQAPDYQPVLVEKSVRIALPNAPRDLLGIIDLADEQDRVTDFKTGSRKKNQDDADGSVQLSIYDAAFRAEMGRAPSEVRLDTIVGQKTKTDRQVLVSHRDDNDFSALANRINVVTSMIQAGIFAPASPGSWWCSPRWCGYWSTCKFVNSERRALSQIE